MKALSKLLAVFSIGVDKKINNYLITHNLEELKQIDRKSFLKEIYKTGKQIVIAEKKFEKHKDSISTLQSRLKTTLSLVSNLRASEDKTHLERNVTLCERLKEQLALAEEVKATLQLTIDKLQERLDALINTINDYDSLIEYQSSLIELNKAKLELNKMKSDNIQHESTLIDDMKRVSDDFDTDVKTHQLIDSKMNNESPAEAKSLDDRIAALFE
jgi:hypothetical protein